MSSLGDIKDQIGRPRTYEMRESTIEPKLSSKKDWFTFLEQHLQYYMPPFDCVTKDHMKAVSTITFHHHKNGNIMWWFSLLIVPFL